MSPLRVRFGSNGPEPEPEESKLVAIEILIESDNLETVIQQYKMSQALLENEAIEHDINCRKTWKTSQQIILHDQTVSMSTLLDTIWVASLDTFINEKNITWLVSSYLLESITKTPWQEKPLLTQSSISNWQKYLADHNEQIIRFGKTEIEYVCYRSINPELGRVNLTFTATTPPNSQTIKLSLPEYHKTCYWGLPGGLVRANDDIPTLDIKIPIEPQIQRTYIMKPSITCKRLDDDLNVLITSFSYNIARGQFCATGSLKFCSRIDMERAVGNELSIMVNGYEFIVICEQPSKNMSFGNKSYSAQFRSRFAELSEPYARVTNYTNQTPKTLAGIMNDVLTNTGWTLDNQMTDYAIPANTFSFRGLTPAGALLSIAKSVGAILDIDEVNKVVSIVPEWPVNPWQVDSAVADLVLNESLILEHNTRTITQTEHNAVFVRGEQEGVACKVIRAGTEGNLFANDVIDPLITDNQAARQRGTCELARSGNKEESTIRTKLTANVPPIRPGMLLGIRYNSLLYKATTDSLSISATINSDGAISINQTVKVLSNV
ncbi:hypothetical protein CWC21_16490 [Pseudoalteromonas phenolica]|nr:hypothetical protein CWC21_16490 [Pseudoalteromonas phenolica]